MITLEESSGFKGGTGRQRTRASSSTWLPVANTMAPKLPQDSKLEIQCGEVRSRDQFQFEPLRTASLSLKAWQGFYRS
jgi:hypothetical protein